ncbi:MAG: outer membrane protein assembly factor [Clostridium sp.]|nr:outer membrane protein assembly factor [Clostridium sp.]
MKLLLLSGVLLLLGACSATKFIPEGSYMLDNISVRSVQKEVKTAPLKGYIRQHPNARWFSLVKVPMGPYALSGRDTSRRVNRFLQRVGEAPVVYDAEQAQRTRRDMESAVFNQGYLCADVGLEERIKGRKLKLVYTINPGQRYRIRRVERRIDDDSLRTMLMADTASSLLRGGMPFDINVLEAERSRIYSLLQNAGYYKFNKQFITYEADTCVGERQVDVKLCLAAYRASVTDTVHPHRRYYVRDVTLVDEGYLQAGYQSMPIDTVRYRGYTIAYHRKPHLRFSRLAESTAIYPGRLYRERDQQQTYNRFGRLGAVMSSSVKMQEVHPDSALLDCRVAVNMNRPYTFSLEPEGTNSAGNLGAAVVVGYQNRNLFRGSEVFNVKLRGAFEAIRGLEGYRDENYIEFSAEAGLTFPEFKLPFLSEAYRRSVQATSEVSVMYDSQNRPEFHRRVLTGALRYRWSRFNRRLVHRIDLLDLNYVFMPWISETFKRDYLDDADNRNAILRYNYENLFIMKLGYSFTFNSQGSGGPSATYGTNATMFRLNVESSGNLLYGASKLFRVKRNAEDTYTLFNIAYAQYVKGDFDYAKSFRIDERNSLALHVGLGVAYPYGNSNILPYEKRYFSGGANSVRGWSVRELGPGTYRGTDGRIDFINQTGDVKLDLSVEYRTFLFWKLHGAAFIDAGNIWTIRAYDEQPGGQFRFDTFWRQIAVAYGLGLRLNFDYFILRLDGGMKAVNPMYEGSRDKYAVIHPHFRRDFTFHFAVGLPF